MSAFTPWPQLQPGACLMAKRHVAGRPDQWLWGTCVCPALAHTATKHLSWGLILAVSGCTHPSWLWAGVCELHCTSRCLHAIISI